jgi:hypothetical protein
LDASDIYLDKIENTMYSGSGSYAVHDAAEKDYRTADDMDIDGNVKMQISPFSHTVSFCPTFYLYNHVSKKNIQRSITEINESFRTQYHDKVIDRNNFSHYLDEELKMAHPLQALIWGFLKIPVQSLFALGDNKTFRFQVAYLGLPTFVYEGKQAPYALYIIVEFRFTSSPGIIDNINCYLQYSAFFAKDYHFRYEVVKNASAQVISSYYTDDYYIKSFIINCGDEVDAPPPLTTLDFGTTSMYIQRVRKVFWYPLSTNNDILDNFRDYFFSEYESINNSLGWMFSNIVFEPIPLPNNQKDIKNEENDK